MNNPPYSTPFSVDDGSLKTLKNRILYAVFYLQPFCPPGRAPTVLPPPSLIETLPPFPRRKDNPELFQQRRLPRRQPSFPAARGRLPFVNDYKKVLVDEASQKTTFRSFLSAKLLSPFPLPAKWTKSPTPFFRRDSFREFAVRGSAPPPLFHQRKGGDGSPIPSSSLSQPGFSSNERRLVPLSPFFPVVKPRSTCFFQVNVVFLQKLRCPFSRGISRAPILLFSFPKTPRRRPLFLA